MLNTSIYLRPLRLEDAEVSYKWRNNPKIWRYTGSKPDTVVTLEMERAWLSSVLSRENEKRFAICLTENDAYIGNVFFTDITEKSALIHIFIGDIENWGRNHAVEAVMHIRRYGFKVLKLENIIGIIDTRNIASAALARLFGPHTVEEFFDEKTQRTMAKWIFSRSSYDEDDQDVLLKTTLKSRKSS